MAEDCGSEHPDQPGVYCNKSKALVHPPHWHEVGTTITASWGEVPTPKRGGNKERMVEIAKNAKREEPVGPPPRAGEVNGPPAEAVEVWSKEAWVGETTVVLHDLLTRVESFTTEQLWPLINAPREKRAMVLPVRHALKEGWMTETGAQRVTGTYHSKDGHVFPLNKLVPVYRSNLFKGAAVDHVVVAGLRDFG